MRGPTIGVRVACPLELLARQAAVVAQHDARGLWEGGTLALPRRLLPHPILRGTLPGGYFDGLGDGHPRPEPEAVGPPDARGPAHRGDTALRDLGRAPQGVGR